MRKAAVFLVVMGFLFLTARGAYPQETPTVGEIVPFGSLPIDWRPDWPSDIPPDAFSLRGGKAASSIVVTTESPEKAEKAEKPAASDYTAKWSASGLVVARPFFSEGAAYSFSLERSSDGRLKRYKLEESVSERGPASEAGKKKESRADDKKKESKPVPSNKEPPKKKGAGSSAEAVTLLYEVDGSLKRAEREGSAGIETSVFNSAGDSLEEIVYDEDGKIVGRNSYVFLGPVLRSAKKYEEDGKETPLVILDYDSGGRVTRLQNAEATLETLYDSAGRPVLLRSSAGKEAGHSERRFQWDQRGLLVRETTNGEDGKTLETSYSYLFDARGEWTERDSVNYSERFGIMAPEKGTRVLRKITYR